MLVYTNCVYWSEIKEFLKMICAQLVRMMPSPVIFKSDI